MVYVRKKKQFKRKKGSSNTKAVYNAPNLSRLSRPHKIPKFLINGTLPREIYCEHLYSDTVQFSNQTLYAYGNFDIRCNDLRDPDYASTGLVIGERNGQPRYRDQLATTFYDHRRVVSSRIDVEFTNKGETPAEDCTVFLYMVNPGTADTMPTNLDYVAEHPNIKLNRQVQRLGSADGGDSTCKLYCTWSETSMNIIDQLNNNGDTGSSPSVVPLFRIGCIANSGLATAIDLDVAIRVRYDTIWSQPRWVTNS